MPTEPQNPASNSDLKKLNEEVTERSREVLAAGQRYSVDQSREAFDAFIQSHRRYVEAHRNWWDVAMPDVAYDSVFGR